jgi:hypothetical protein
VAQGARKRRKRRADYRPPARAGEARARRAEAAAAARPRPDRPARGRRRRERPPAPWGAFPLVELVVLLALVLLIAGFFVQGTRGVTMIGAGVALGSLAGLELSIREHFAGYKSHSTVLAGAPTVLVLGVGFFAIGWSPAVATLVAALVFFACFYMFREAFKRRSGGLGWR